ncbi:MAG: hypothetical protein MZV64_19875 [Ignavibacteriales bacterium]|nr:hypothetical protein [Ignavibacteriales bacterium]
MFTLQFWAYSSYGDSGDGVSERRSAWRRPTRATRTSQPTGSWTCLSSQRAGCAGARPVWKPGASCLPSADRRSG